MIYLLRAALFLYLIYSIPTMADALMVNQSRKSATIVEFHIDASGIRVELEIGFSAAESF
jgi:hypothetical protein